MKHIMKHAETPGRCLANPEVLHMSINWLKTTSALLVLSFALSGCALALGGLAGGLIVDEGMVENDGKFDPFENTDAGREIYN